MYWMLTEFSLINHLYSKEGHSISLEWTTELDIAKLGIQCWQFIQIPVLLLQKNMLYSIIGHLHSYMYFINCLLYFSLSPTLPPTSPKSTYVHTVRITILSLCVSQYSQTSYFMLFATLSVCVKNNYYRHQHLGYYVKKVIGNVIVIQIWSKVKHLLLKHSKPKAILCRCCANSL